MLPPRSNCLPSNGALHLAPGPRGKRLAPPTVALATAQRSARLGCSAPPNGRARLRRLYGGGGFGGTDRFPESGKRPWGCGCDFWPGLGGSGSQLREEGSGATLPHLPSVGRLRPPGPVPSPFLLWDSPHRLIDSALGRPLPAPQDLPTPDSPVAVLGFPITF